MGFYEFLIEIWFSGDYSVKSNLEPLDLTLFFEVFAFFRLVKGFPVRFANSGADLGYFRRDLKFSGELVKVSGEFGRLSSG